MIIQKGQLKPYIDDHSDLIPLHQWNKQTIDKKGKVILRGKTPLFPNWTKSKRNIKKTIELIKKGYNVGYRISSKELIIDVDPRNFVNGENSLDDLHEFLGITNLADICPTVITGSGGYHFYMLKPEGVNVRETIEQFPGIEFKTVGRQVVVAGSKHPNGNYYEWDDFAPMLGKQPRVPDALINLLQFDLPEQQAGAGVINNDQLSRLLTQLPIDSYGDNDTWFKIMCAAHHGTAGSGIDEFIEWSIGDPNYESDEHVIRCRWASLSEKPVNITVNTLYKEVLAHGGNTAVETAEEDFNDFKDDGLDDDFDDVIAKPKVKESYKSGVALTLAKSINLGSSEDEIIQAIRAALQAGTIEQVKSFSAIQINLKWSKGQLNDVIKQIQDRIVNDLGRVLAEKALEIKFHNGKGLVLNVNGQFWHYNGKFWTTVTRQYVGKKVTEVLDSMRAKIKITVKENALVNESVGIIERLTAVRDDKLRLRERPHPVVNCNNGELWIRRDGTSKLRPHRPESYLLQMLDVEYSPGSECPLFDKSIRDTFSRFDDTDDIVRHYEEYMGYVLHPDKHPAKWWLFKGPGGDGKTTLMRILAGLLGDAVLPESIERFKGGAGGDNHATAELPGKLLIYDDDLNRHTILPDGTLKKLSEDGELTANPKGFPGFKFTKVCTATMLSNGYPKTRDLTRGFRRRAMVIPFNRGFHEDGAILNLAQQIIKNELAGVLNRALQGLQRLRERGDFREPLSCKLARETWISESNAVALFVNERIDITDDKHDTVNLNDLYEDYSQWCHHHGIVRVDTKQQFRGTMEDMDLWYGKLAGNKRGFKGVILRDLIVDDFDDLEEW